MAAAGGAGSDRPTGSFAGECGALVEQYQRAMANAITDITPLLQTELAISQLFKRAVTAEDKAVASTIFERAFVNTYPTSYAASGARTLFLNLISGSQTPALQSAAYRPAPQAPTVTSYHFIAPYYALIRLPHSALASAPETLRRSIGSYDPAQTDIFFIVTNSRMAVRGDRTLHEPLRSLVSFHRWAFPEAKAGSDIHRDIPMGIFPVEEAGAASTDEPIAVDHLEARRVHAHPSGDGTMLYSPCAAAYQFDPDAPFSAFWAVAKDGERTCIAKIISIKDPDYALCDPFVDALRTAGSLAECKAMLAERKEYIERVINDQFHGMRMALRHAPANMDAFYTAFDALPTWQKNGIYKHLWIHKGSPMGVHHDFGRASFHHHEDLKAEHHASIDDFFHALTRYQNHLVDTLITSQLELLTPSLAKSEKEEEFLALGIEFTTPGLETVAWEHFETLSPEEKKGVFRALWELEGYPMDRGSNFGEDYFRSAGCPPQTRARALNLFASRI